MQEDWAQQYWNMNFEQLDISLQPLCSCINCRTLKKLAAWSIQHEAKIAYYAFDVIQFFVRYAAR
jgi:hypothetical protein